MATIVATGKDANTQVSPAEDGITKQVQNFDYSE